MKGKKEQSTEKSVATHEEDKKRDEIKQQNEAFAAEALKAFYSNYPPAKDIAKASYFLTTTEIINIVNGLFPSVFIDAILLTRFLQQSGYNYVAMRDQFNPSFKWMVK